MTLEEMRNVVKEAVEFIDAQITVRGADSVDVIRLLNNLEKAENELWKRSNNG